MRVEIDLPDDIADAISPEGADPSTVASFAVRRFAGWISGTERYRSLTELNTEWAAAFFQEIVPGVIPSRERLHNSLGMSYGQAGYIARVLAERNQAEWRRTAVIELRDALSREEKDARDLVRSKEPLKSRTLVLSKQARRELDILLDDDDKRPRIPPRSVGHVGSHVYVEVTAEDIVRLIDGAEDV